MKRSRHFFSRKEILRFYFSHNLVLYHLFSIALPQRKRNSFIRSPCHPEPTAKVTTTTLLEELTRVRDPRTTVSLLREFVWSQFCSCSKPLSLLMSMLWFLLSSSFAYFVTLQRILVAVALFDVVSCWYTSRRRDDDSLPDLLSDSNSNGSYYYSNDNGSTYYNSGRGYSSYTPRGGK